MNRIATERIGDVSAEPKKSKIFMTKVAKTLGLSFLPFLSPLLEYKKTNWQLNFVYHAGGGTCAEINMLKFTKTKRKAIGSLIAAGFLFGMTPFPAAHATDNTSMQMLSASLASQLGGIPISGTAASYMPIPQGDVKAIPLCYINPTRPQANETVNVICALIKTDPGTRVVSSVPDMFGLSNKLGGGKVLFSSVTLGESKSSTYFSWSLERDILVKSADGKSQEKKTLQGSTSVIVTIAPYTGASSLNNNGDASDTGTGVTTGTSSTSQCNEDQTICYNTTCDADGSCETTCTGSNCPDTDGTTTTTTSPRCDIGYQMNDNGSCVFQAPTDEGCQTGYSKNEDGICVQPKTETECTSTGDTSLCTDCIGSVCIPYDPSKCVTGSLCENTNEGGGTGETGGGTTGGGTTSSTTDTSALDDAAQNALNNLFGDSDDSSYNAPTDDWLDSSDGSDGSDNLDNYLGDASDGTGSDIADGTTTDTGGFDGESSDTDNESNTDDDGAISDDSASTDSSSNGASGSSGATGNGGDSSLGNLLDKYQDGTTGLDALMNGDNSDLLGKIKGSTSSLSDKLAGLLGLNEDSSASPSKSNNDLYDIARQLLLANGMTMDDIKNGRNYDANSAFTEPKTSWDMNRITTLIRNKKLKVDDKGNAVSSSSNKSSGSSKSSSNSSGSSSGSGKNASLTKK